MLTSFFTDPLNTLLSLLIALPGVLLALSAHEAAHGWVAYKCGDPTAKMMGRITLNPLKHIDPVGFLCMLLAGFGWARPVPVNPMNFRNYRRDDLKVSLAGITANLLLALLGFMILMTIVTSAYSALPEYDSIDAYMEEVIKNEAASENGKALKSITAVVHEEDGDMLMLFQKGDTVFDSKGIYYNSTPDALFGKESLSRGSLLIETAYGKIASIFYEMLFTFVFLNIGLAAFNLIPLPPLDGYHVLNDLVLKRPLFADVQAQRIGTGILFALIMIGNIHPEFDILAKVLEFVRTGVTGIFSAGWRGIITLIGII